MLILMLGESESSVKQLLQKALREERFVFYIWLE